MPKYVIELIEEERDVLATGSKRFFGHARGDDYVTMYEAPWIIEASCFYDAVIKMWVRRLDVDRLPTPMRFDPEHPANSDLIRMWSWGDRELIQVKRVR